jgi:hypothetical protein
MVYFGKYAPLDVVREGQNTGKVKRKSGKWRKIGKKEEVLMENRS